MAAPRSRGTRVREEPAVTRGPGTSQAGIPGSTGFVFLLPVALVLLIVAQSAFTVSDLFITHYALLLPLIPIAAGLAAAALFRGLWLRKGRLPAAAALFAVLAVLWWGTADLWTTIRYHAVLTQSGGYSGHSDAIYRLANYLDSRGYSAPLALDWGLDAPTRFLTAGRVNPVEVFGYERFDQPDVGFPDRMKVFLANPDNVYLAHMPGASVFQGRLDALEKLAVERGLFLTEEIRFADRSGQPVFVIYRALPPPAEE